MIVAHAMLKELKKYIVVVVPEKRQCSVQLIVGRDDISLVRPTLLFQGESKRIKSEKRYCWDRRINVPFQKKAWCDDVVMEKWTTDELCNIFTNPAKPGSSGKLLVADVHMVQQPNEVKRLLQKNSVPPGQTSCLKLDVAVNKLYNNLTKKQL